MIIVDVEATGTEPHKHSIVSIGALDFRNPENQFYGECRIWEGAHVMEEALAVNGFTRDDIVNPTKPTLEELMRDFLTWTEACGEHMIGGQNPSFDRDFLKASAERYSINWPLAHRTIDLHSVCYFHILRRGVPPPMSNKRSDLSLDRVLQYVGIPEEPKPHNALTGAKVTAEAFSRLFYDKSLFEEFSVYPVPWKV